MRPRLALPFSLIVLCAAAACTDEANNDAATTPTDATAEEQPFYVGEWAADTTWCTDQSEGFPITITADRFEGRENICEMREITETPEGGWTASLSCQSEGATVNEPIVLAPAGEQMAITWPERGTEPTLFSRCE